MSKEQIQIKVSKEQLVKHAESCRNGETRSLNEIIGGIALIENVTARTNLTGANLSGCIMSRCNVDFATLDDVNLSGATIIKPYNVSMSSLKSTILINIKCIDIAKYIDISRKGAIQSPNDLILAMKVMFVQDVKTDKIVTPRVRNYLAAAEYCLDEKNGIQLTSTTINTFRAYAQQIKDTYNLSTPSAKASPSAPLDKSQDSKEAKEHKSAAISHQPEVDAAPLSRSYAILFKHSSGSDDKEPTKIKLGNYSMVIPASPSGSWRARALAQKAAASKDQAQTR